MNPRRRRHQRLRRSERRALEHNTSARALSRPTRRRLAALARIAALIEPKPWDGVVRPSVRLDLGEEP